MNKLAILHDISVITKVTSRVCIWKNEDVSVISEVIQEKIDDLEESVTTKNIYSLISAKNGILISNSDLLKVMKRLDEMLNPPTPKQIPIILDHSNASGIIVKMIDRRTKIVGIGAKMINNLNDVLKITIESWLVDYDASGEIELSKIDIKPSCWNEMLLRNLYLNCGVWAEWRK